MINCERRRGDGLIEYEAEWIDSQKAYEIDWRVVKTVFEYNALEQVASETKGGWTGASGGNGVENATNNYIDANKKKNFELLLLGNIFTAIFFRRYSCRGEG